MFSRIEAKQTKDILLPITQRISKGVYFLRILSYSEESKELIWNAHQKAAENGTVIDMRIQNPDERQITYLTETLGNDFQANEEFVRNMLAKWVPRMSQKCREEFSNSLCSIFYEQKSQGKSDGILRNIYIKMMCWLYYKFERLMPQLGSETVPLILYIGSGITRHELMFLRIMSNMGCDILMVEPEGDDSYRSIDPESKHSQLMMDLGSVCFPNSFSLKEFRHEMNSRKQMPNQHTTEKGTDVCGITVASNTSGFTQKKFNIQTSRTTTQPEKQNFSNIPQYAATKKSTPCHIQTGRNPINYTGTSSRTRIEELFIKPNKKICTNAWMKNPTYSEILNPVSTRTDDSSLCCTALIRMYGAQDRSTYANELLLFHQNLKKTGRNICVQEGKLKEPTPEELRKIRRRNYNSVDEMIADLALNIPVGAHRELQSYIQQAFMLVMLDAAKYEQNINKLTVIGVYMLCWIIRYMQQLFNGWKDGNIACFIFLGGTSTQKEAYFLQMLSEMPVDILILVPDLNKICQFNHPYLLDLKYEYSVSLDKYPTENSNYHIRTVAAHAESDLNNILYGDSGIYREKQFSKANAIVLQTTYDEMYILWNEELRFRPNFSSDSEHVNIPVLFAKVSGVENGKLLEYWQKIKLLKTTDTCFSNQFPLLSPGIGNKYLQLAQKGLKNGKLNRELIESDRNYPFGLLRMELQEHMLDKIQLMLDNRLIKGIFENGTEYTVISTVFNIKKELLRMIQAFDFTKKNPKLVCISTKDTMASLEDAIMLTFLSLIGFDIVIFVPTGYQTIERYLNGYYPIEYQIGEYIYDQEIPDFDTLPTPKNRTWLNNIIRRVN